MRKLSNEELGRPGLNEFKDLEKRNIVLVLDNVRSLHNIGSIFRTSDAFRISALFLCGITAAPPHREIHKTALGAENSVSWRYFNESIEAVKELKDAGFRVYSLEQADHSIDLRKFQWDGSKTAFILGNEVDGVHQELIDISDGCIEIPQEGTKHSFNVSVSAGILLWKVVHGA